MREITAKTHNLDSVRFDAGQAFARAVAVLIVVAAGAGIAAALPAGADTWMVVSSFLAPASLAFAAYWWIDQQV